jgi:hypothetical protein
MYYLILSNVTASYLKLHISAAVKFIYLNGFQILLSQGCFLFLKIINNLNCYLCSLQLYVYHIRELKWKN